MVKVVAPDDFGEVLSLIESQQLDAATACSYIDGAKTVEEQLNLISPPWRETMRIARNDAGELLGAVCIEISHKTKRMWIYGPWTLPSDWDEVAGMLVVAALEQCPPDIDDYEISGDLANVRMRKLAKKLGWKESKVAYIYTAPAEVARSGPEDPGYIRDATRADLAYIQKLHEKFYPNTYLSAEEIMVPKRKNIVIVDDSQLREFIKSNLAQLPEQDSTVSRRLALTELLKIPISNEVIAYASGWVNPNTEGCIEFVAVKEPYRHNGLAVQMLRALSRRLEAKDIFITALLEKDSYWERFNSLGYRLYSALRGYRHAGQINKIPERLFT